MNEDLAAMPPPARGAANAGFSLLEVLVASLLLLVIALGLIPLFTRAMLDNASGRDSSTATNFDRNQIETLSALSFDAAELTLPAGQALLETKSTYSRGAANIDNDSSEVWSPGVLANTALSRWTRTVRVQQFNASDLKDDDFELDNPLPGGTDRAQYQLKQIEVFVQGTNQSTSALGVVLGGGPRVTFRTLRSIG